MAELPDLDREIERLGALPRAKAPEHLLPRIMTGLARTRTFTPPEWRALAAAAVLILSLNVTALISYQTSLTEAGAAEEWSLLNNYEFED
ncbi:hypothetical protein [Lewinella sp. 4G2]|uniref:hypothetical protein n=1 Tax=Lewinella sp. 4G2 TaxID=1803372 RepID=UPI0012FAB629|nr:hypothetical protein [Lewinella sp. 4G2]